MKTATSLFTRKAFIIVVYVTVGLNVVGQNSNFDCNKVLKGVPYFVSGSTASPDSAMIDSVIFKDCGKLDSIDCELVKPQVLGFILLKYPVKEKKASYQAILNSIKEYKKSKEYSEFREYMISYKTFERRKANINTWETDKQLLLKIGMKEDEEMARLKIFIAENKEKNWTYKEALISFKENEQKKKEEELLKDFGGFENLGGLERFKKEGKYGFKDQAGKVVVQPIYDEAFDFIGGVAQVTLNNKMGLIDSTGKEIVALKYDNVNTFSEGMAQVSLNEKWGFVDETGKEVIALKYDGLIDFSEGMAGAMLSVTSGDTPSLKFGFIDKTGKEVIPFKYTGLDKFSGGLAVVELNGKFGFIDKIGTEAISLKYDGANSFSEDLASVKLNGKWGFIDKAGKLVIPLKYNSGGSFSEGSADVELNGKFIQIDQSGKEIK